MLDEGFVVLFDILECVNFSLMDLLSLFVDNHRSK